jgi:hypothetical protein
VKVTKVPAQIAPDGEATMLTLTGSTGLTVIVTELDVAGFNVVHVTLEVSIQVTTFPLAKAELV